MLECLLSKLDIVYDQSTHLAGKLLKQESAKVIYKLEQFVFCFEPVDHLQYF